MKDRIAWYLSLALTLSATSVSAQNPIIRDQFSADPTVRVFNNRFYLFPSHDILANKDRGRIGWFCMEDYHVFSSSNLIDWQDHGMIVSQTKVPWTNPTGYSMWAPDCIERKGKYYFYFPAGPKEGRGFTVGVAVADKPEGPYVPQAEPIKKVNGIDPNVFIDKDGQAYLYWSGGNFYCAKLKENMLELASDPVVLQGFPSKGLKEGPFLFERGGTYYMTYPHVENQTERLEYATSKSPMGPFKFAGVMMDEKPGCWTNHQSVVQYKNQWYLFYHHNDYSPSFDKARSARADYLSFTSDGTIKKVVPTLRGVGISPASHEIQIDRYSKISDSGVSTSFLTPEDPFKGWFASFAATGAWLEYNRVQFDRKRAKLAIVRARSKSGGSVDLRLDSATGPVIATVFIPSGDNFTNLSVPTLTWKSGVHDLVITSKSEGAVDIDWVKFE